MSNEPDDLSTDAVAEAAEAEAAKDAADDGFIDTNGDGADDSEKISPAESDEAQADAVALTDEALDEADSPPDDYDPGGDFTSFEDTAPPGAEPGNDAVKIAEINTDFEQATIEKNQRRYDLRSAGYSSAEVNQIEEDERAASRS